MNAVNGARKSHFHGRKAGMNPMERVWKRMKVMAAKFAHHRTLVSLRESQDAVLKLCRQEKAQVPPREALEFLAKELLRLTVEARFPG